MGRQRRPDDAMIRQADTYWLRTPLGKLHNDRYVPLHPILIDLIADYRAKWGPSRSGRLVDRNDGKPFDRRTIHRYVAAVAKRAGGPRPSPPAPPHPDMRMTMTYARISDRTVADEYFRVTEAVEANYGRTDVVPDEAVGRRLAADHRRMLGNGMCTRPVTLDCSFESACERCNFFETGPKFIPILRRQRDHAIEHDQKGRAELFSGLIEDVDGPG